MKLGKHPCCNRINVPLPNVTRTGWNPVLTTMKPLTREQLIKNGTCCGLGCKNCPYIPKAVKGNKNLTK